MQDLYDTLVSPYKEYCNGFAGIGNYNQGYILGLTNSIGVAESEFNHNGSTILDQINAFDLAEVSGPYIGQLNMSIVSSFCGPQGLIWGYDIANNLSKRKEFEGIKQIEYHNKIIKIYNADFLIEALKALFGTVDNKKFIIKPGSHVPFASKNMKTTKSSTIYSAIGIGIASNRKKDACLLMEDFGTIDGWNKSGTQKRIVENLAKSVLRIGENQKIDFKECLISLKIKNINKGETGCALVAAPYFTLAQDAIPKDKDKRLSFEKLKNISLEEWKKMIK